jgi:hypothetical protein
MVRVIAACSASGQGLERVRLEHPAVAGRREDEARRCPEQGDALLARRLLDTLDRLLLALLELVLEDLAPGPVVLVLKGRLQRVRQSSTSRSMSAASLRPRPAGRCSALGQRGSWKSLT